MARPELALPAQTFIEVISLSQGRWHKLQIIVAMEWISSMPGTREQSKCHSISLVFQPIYLRPIDRRLKLIITISITRGTMTRWPHSLPIKWEIKALIFDRYGNSLKFTNPTSQTSKCIRILKKLIKYIMIKDIKPCLLTKIIKWSSSSRKSAWDIVISMKELDWLQSKPRSC